MAMRAGRTSPKGQGSHWALPSILNQSLESVIKRFESASEVSGLASILSSIPRTPTLAAGSAFPVLALQDFAYPGETRRAV
jgi:hypothetical protein